MPQHKMKKGDKVYLDRRIPQNKQPNGEVYAILYDDGDVSTVVVYFLKETDPSHPKGGDKEWLDPDLFEGTWSERHSSYMIWDYSR